MTTPFNPPLLRGNKIVLLLIAAVVVSCSDRWTERVFEYGAASDSTILIRGNQFVFSKDYRDYLDALEFANWVKKKYPHVWREYYSTITEVR